MSSAKLAAPAVRSASAAPAIRSASAAPAIRTASAAPAIRTASAAPAIRSASAAPAIRSASAAPAVHSTAPASVAPAIRADLVASAAPAHRPDKHLVHAELTREVIGAAIEVHRVLGAGLLESAYQQGLSREFELRRLPFERELALPLAYKGVDLDCGYRIDLLVAGRVVVEVKAVRALLPGHEAQLLTYMRLGGYPVGLLVNFHGRVLRAGIVRRVL